MLSALMGCVAAVVAVAVVPAGAASLKKVEFRTGFGYGPWDAGFAVAIDKGYYKAAGLDVSVKPGLGSSSNVQLVANNKTTFTDVGGPVIATAVNKGAKVKAVASFFPIGGAGFVAKPELTKPEQLAGHTFGGPIFDFGTALLPVFEKKTGVSGIKVQSVDPAAVPNVFKEGRVDMMSATGWAEVPELEADGVKFHYFSCADYGMNTFGQAITVNSSLLQKDPATVKGFVTATAKGFAFTYAHPEAAAKIVKKVWPTTNSKYDLAVTKVLKAFSHSPDAKTANLGWMSGKVWKQTVDLLVDTKQIPKSIPASSLYENVLPRTAP
jgi:NitT/TauT family transport system substrate-binding protein